MLDDRASTAVATPPHEQDASPEYALELSVVMPCLNEERTVGVCVKKAVDTMRHWASPAKSSSSTTVRPTAACEIAAAAGRGSCSIRSRATATPCGRASPRPAVASSSWATATTATTSPTWAVRRPAARRGRHGDGQSAERRDQAGGHALASSLDRQPGADRLPQLRSSAPAPATATAACAASARTRSPR